MSIPGGSDVLLELFVRGQSPRSHAALQAVKHVCEERLHGRYSLEVVDIHQQPERMRGAGVIAIPALVRRSPGPPLRIVGRLTEERIVDGLGLQ